MSLNERSFEGDVAEACHHFGVVGLPYGVLSGGTLTGKYITGEDTPRSRQNLSPDFQPRYNGPARRRGDEGVREAGRGVGADADRIGHCVGARTLVQRRRHHGHDVAQTGRGVPRGVPAGDAARGAVRGDRRDPRAVPLAHDDARQRQGPAPRGALGQFGRGVRDGRVEGLECEEASAGRQEATRQAAACTPLTWHGTTDGMMMSVKERPFTERRRALPRRRRRPTMSANASLLDGEARVVVALRDDLKQVALLRTCSCRGPFLKSGRDAARHTPRGPNASSAGACARSRPYPPGLGAAAASGAAAQEAAAGRTTGPAATS